MEPKVIVGLIALGWLICSVLLMARFIRRGLNLVEELATRDPLTYQALGRPRPGYFESARRTRFAQFVGRREYEELTDEWLSAQFEAYRKQEVRFIVSILGSGAVIVLLGFVVRHAA